jgi:hypothetical protein
MVGYAAEYELQDARVKYRGGWDCIGNMKVSPLYPLLLQRARQGWNKAHKTITYFIDMNKEYIELNCDVIDPPLFWYNKYSSEDEALEQALKYIYEQEKKSD